MPIGAQPPGRKGTFDTPYSALNLRLLLAAFGFVVCTVLGVLSWRAGWRWPAALLALWAVAAAVDLVVIQLRRRARRRAEPGRDHSVFE
jgi:membrane protein implicated in regulation of membrane protease activity